MSGIAGIYSADGAAVDPALLQRMTDALARRGPDGEGHWIGGPIGLAHRSLVTTPEAQQEKQPIADERGQRWIVWDGRLDNRREVIAALDVGAERPDPEIVLAAYGAWGCDGFARLIGDFAFALWDGPARSLVCARDPLGVKPLYYHWDGRRLLFGSEVKALLADGALPRRPDESTITDYLLMGFRDCGATFFEGILQLPPAHLLRVGSTGLWTQRYWEADPSREVRYARSDDYCQEIRERFAEAVACRLRSVSPVGVLLSGGIDSTSVAAMAETTRHGQGGVELEGFTLLAEAMLSDEWDALEHLSARLGMPIRRVAPETPQGRLTAFEPFLPCAETPHYNAWFTPFLLVPAAARGCRVLLTGFGADELVLKSEDGYLADLFHSLRLGRLIREVKSAARAYGGGSARGTLLNLFWNDVPPYLKRAMKALTRRQIPSWLSSGFARRARVDRWVMPQESRRFPRLCQEEAYRALTNATTAFALNQTDGLASAFALECRHPYLDRRLIELFLAMPSDVKLGRGFRKQLIQHALSGITPGGPRGDESAEKAIPSMDRESCVRAEAKRWTHDLFHPHALVFEYVDRKQAERMRDLYVERGAPYRNLLWNFAKLELWLQEWFGR
jgi:asparagine synthase (glutamine-hydrolysing)